MAKLSKRARLIREKVDVLKDYEINEAIALLKELATAKFNESVDVAINLGIDARKSDQNVRGATVLPTVLVVTVRVAVFTQGANADKAKEAGADIVGMEDLAEQVKAGQHGLRRCYCNSRCNARSRSIRSNLRSTWPYA